MKRRMLGLVPIALAAVLLGYCSQVVAHDTYGFGYGRSFTRESLNGTYYIPCACEGADGNGAPIYTGGMGKVYFDGHGNVTLTQHDLYIQQNGMIIRLVTDGVGADGTPAQREGIYTVDSEGFGHIVWDGGLCTPNPDNPLEGNCPSLMITAADGTRATGVYLVIPNGVFIPNPNGEGGTGVLIHVTANKQ